ncbi:MAG: 2-dehydro-3-deoxygalactonokinase [Rhodocyclaceae bacterium]
MDHSTHPPALIALDWGTSSLRAYLMDSAGCIIDTRRAGHGIQHLPPAPTRGEAFAAAFASIIEPWRQRAPRVPKVACGMVGSAQGWREAPYASCPADLSAIARRAVQIECGEGEVLHIVPGVMCDAAGTPPDVMRGEETQIFGALAMVPELAKGACLLMPGTHSKWVGMAQGYLAAFSTYMTGELYAVLSAHSTLGLMMEEGPADIDGGAFEQGVQAARQALPGDLPHQLFAVRTLGLTARLQRGELGNYLSGLLIGHEITSGLQRNASLLASGAPLVLVGEPALCQRYTRALQWLGGPAPLSLDHAAPRGLWAVAQAAGLLSEEVGHEQ